jgi:predicted membrane protein
VVIVNSLYNFSLKNKPLINIFILIIAPIILLTIISFLFQIALYLVPIVLIGWSGYKLFDKAKMLIKKNKKSMLKDEVEVMASEEFVRNAVENNTVIDVEYREI